MIAILTGLMVFAGQNAFAAEATSQATTRKIREVKVMVVAGLEYRLYYQDWQDRARHIIDGASRHTEAQLGLKFVATEFRAWEYTGGRSPKSPDETIEQLTRFKPGKCDLVVALTLVAFPGPEVGSEIRGFTQYFSQYVVVPDQWVAVGAQTRLVHELCHVFGAFHEANPNSVMRPAYQGTPRHFEFSNSTREIIRLTKDLDLTRGVAGLAPEAARRIREIYRAEHHPREPLAEDPVSRAYEAAAKRAEKFGDADTAKAMRQTAEQFSATGKLPARS
jgi:hypothetical protein